jgi:hypothetical protein
MSRFGRRDALADRWHAEIDHLAPLGDLLDAELAVHLGNAVEMAAMADLADVPPNPGFFSALDQDAAAGFPGGAGFDLIPGDRAAPILDPASALASWRKRPERAVPSSTDVDQFLGEAWVLASLRHSYRSKVRNLIRKRFASTSPASTTG